MRGRQRGGAMMGWLEGDVRAGIILRYQSPGEGDKGWAGGGAGGSTYLTPRGVICRSYPAKDSQNALWKYRPCWTNTDSAPLHTTRVCLPVMIILSLPNWSFWPRVRFLPLLFSLSLSLSHSHTRLKIITSNTYYIVVRPDRII